LYTTTPKTLYINYLEGYKYKIWWFLLDILELTGPTGEKNELWGICHKIKKRTEMALYIGYLYPGFLERSKFYGI